MPKIGVADIILYNFHSKNVCADLFGKILKTNISVTALSTHGIAYNGWSYIDKT